MKGNNLVYGLWDTLKVVCLFCRQHYNTYSMLLGTYVLQSPSIKPATGIDAVLQIKPYGSLYRLTRTEYICNEPEKEQTWLASYSWHSGGALVEIGGDNCCVFDTESKSLYLETLTEQGKSTVEQFIKSL